MDALELAKQAKKQNIIDMAVGFTAMMPLFQERSADLIREKLADLFEGLDRISSDQDFSKMHRGFCQWFVKTIRLAKTEATPGAVIAIQTFGDFLNFNPHCHVLCTDGVFYGNGSFKVAAASDTAPLGKIFQHRVLGMLLGKGKITEEVVKLILSWRHSGFIRLWRIQPGQAPGVMGGNPPYFWRVKPRPPPKTTGSPKTSERHIDYSTSQLPVLARLWRACPPPEGRISGFMSTRNIPRRSPPDFQMERRARGQVWLHSDGFTALSDETPSSSLNV